MRFIVRLIQGSLFLVGFLIGLLGITLAGTVWVIYLFTGKFPSIQVGQPGQPIFKLSSVEEIKAVIRAQMSRRGDRIKEDGHVSQTQSATLG